MKLRFLPWLLSGLFFPGLLLAQTIPDSLVQQVAYSEEWIKQLYLTGRERNDGFQTRIHSDKFYFSGSERVDPVQELRLSQIAIFSNLDRIDNQHPACRFPGRFLFLNRALQLGHSETLLDGCDAFNNWARFDQYDTLSIVMVEGYYGNPASSFGHLVLRHGRSDGTRQLLDTSINFGARVPRNESPISYIINGLTGGYQASFTIENYYRQDLVYTQVEHRDMWNYALDLSEAQRRFFLAHVWELLDSPSTYYFLKNNCAFAVAEVLEIVFERELLNQNTLYYPPVTLFHELEAIDQQAGVSVIKAKQFIPSQQSVLKALFDALTPGQRKVFSQYTGPERRDITALTRGLEETEATELTEALISFYSYLIGGYPELGTELYDRRRALILARLQYPSGRHLQATEIEPTTEPGKTARVSRLTAGVAGINDRIGYTLGWTPYSLSAIDLGNQDFSNLTLLAIETRWQGEQIEADLGLIRVAQRSPVNDRLPGNWPLSWTVDLAWQTDTWQAYRAGGQVELALGQSSSVGPLLASGLAELRQSGSETGVGVAAEAGYAQLTWLSWVGGVSYTRWVSGYSMEAAFDSRLGFSPSWSLELGLSHMNRDDESTEMSGLLKLNWHYR